MNSVVSYPNRGKWGQSSWRGNTTGHILVDLFNHFKPEFVIDPAEGSGTTRDVCRDLGIQYKGLDLHSGFNLLKNSLSATCPQQADMVFFHPPYGDMIRYSGNVWGNGHPHPDDLSRCRDTEDFLHKLQHALINIYDAVKRNGHYSVLIGDHRKNGEYISYQSEIIQMGIGSLKNVLIKTQHNCVSDRRNYSGSFIPIKHEYLLVFRKDMALHAIGMKATQRLSKSFYGTWKNLVEHALRKLGGRAPLKDIYEYVGIPTGHNNQHIQAKIRQVVQRYCIRVDRGIYELAA